MTDKVEYAQLLNDDSEIKFYNSESFAHLHTGLNARTPEGFLTLQLPVILPVNTVPVIELFLK